MSPPRHNNKYNSSPLAVRSDREEIIQRLTGELVKVGLTQLRTLDKDGLPKLGPCQSVPTAAWAPEEDYNNPAALQEMVFRPLRDCRLDPRRQANVWALHRTSESWRDQDDIKRWVQATIQDVVAAAGLPEGLQCCEELGISAERSSTWVVRRHGDPVGVVGVKRPGAKIVDNQRVHGQMYDCMRRLQAFHGLRRVFGIVTTYEQWRVYWLGGTDALARTEALDACPRSTEAEEAVEDDEKEAEEAERVVNGSGVYEWHDSGLPLVLASVLGKMERAPIYGLMPAHLRPRIHIDATRWWWTGPCEIEEDSTTGTAECRRARKLVLLQDLGAGADGRVWKACTTGGKVCVLKFACRERNEAPKRRRARLGVERTHWREVWGVHGVRRSAGWGLRAADALGSPAAARGTPRRRQGAGSDQNNGQQGVLPRGPQVAAPRADRPGHHRTSCFLRLGEGCDRPGTTRGRVEHGRAAASRPAPLAKTLWLWGGGTHFVDEVDDTRAQTL